MDDGNCMNIDTPGLRSSVSNMHAVTQLSACNLHYSAS